MGHCVATGRRSRNSQVYFFAPAPAARAFLIISTLRKSAGEEEGSDITEGRKKGSKSRTTWEYFTIRSEAHSDRVGRTQLFLRQIHCCPC